MNIKLIELLASKLEAAQAQLDEAGRQATEMSPQRWRKRLTVNGQDFIWDYGVVFREFPECGTSGCAMGYIAVDRDLAKKFPDVVRAARAGRAGVAAAEMAFALGIDATTAHNIFMNQDLFTTPGQVAALLRELVSA